MACVRIIFRAPPRKTGDFLSALARPSYWHGAGVWLIHHHHLIISLSPLGLSEQLQHSIHRTPRRAPRCAPMLRAAARPFPPQPIHKRAAGNGFLVCGGAGSFAQFGALALNTAAAPPPSRHRALAPRALAPTPRAGGRAQPQERSAPPNSLCARLAAVWGSDDRRCRGPRSAQRASASALAPQLLGRSPSA